MKKKLDGMYELEKRNPDKHVPSNGPGDNRRDPDVPSNDPGVTYDVAKSGRLA